jgi:hypothetical protein
VTNPRNLVALVVALAALTDLQTGHASNDTRETANEIHAEASLPNSSERGLPLPLAAVWNAGWTSEGYTPLVQIKMVQDGHHILPTFYLPTPSGDTKGSDYYLAPMDEARQLRLPLTFKSTQWEDLLLNDSKAVLSSRSCTRSGLSLKPKCLLPFGPVESWERAGTQWGGTSLLKQLQADYPDPPLVVFLSNNEAPRLPWTSIESDPGYRSQHGENDDTATRRSMTANAWSERYHALESSFRRALVNAHWSANAIFVGYNALGPSFAGRWPGWQAYSLAAEGNMAAESGGWDGASVAFYVNIGDSSTDYTVWSPQIAAMNWVPMKEEVQAKRPGFWFEMSTWDGAVPGDAASKPAQYARRGQAVTSARYGGMVQFGMWLLRPRAVREYRGYLERRADTAPSFDQVVEAVDRIYKNPTLQTFWRRGTLVANDSHAHPYGAALPTWIAGVKRWFLLDTSIDPPRPWNLNTELKIFSIALAMGQPGSRRWLIYAHAPLGDRDDVAIDIPEFKPVTMSVKVGGTFAVVDEQNGTVHEP